MEGRIKEWKKGRKAKNKMRNSDGRTENKGKIQKAAIYMNKR